jgi:hypothetical protein
VKVLIKFPEAKLNGRQNKFYEVCKNLTRHFKIEDNVLLPGKVLTKEEFSNSSKGLVLCSIQLRV